MKLLAKLAFAALVSAGLVTDGALAANLKEAKDVRIAFVVHGSASDPYWSVVKRGVDDAAALTGAQVEYHSPQVFDVVEQARLMDAAIATKPDGIAVSIADADALREIGAGGARRRHPGGGGRLRRGPRRGDGRHALCRHRVGIRFRQEGRRAPRQGRRAQGRLHQPRGRQRQPRRPLPRPERRPDAIGGGTEVVAVTPDPATSPAAPRPISRRIPTCRPSSPWAQALPTR